MSRHLFKRPASPQQASPQRAWPVLPLIQPLEARQLLSAAASPAASAGPVGTLTGSSLTISGTPQADVISATAVPSSGTLMISVNGQSTSYPLSDVTEIEIDGYAGNDRITVGLNVPPTLIRGEAGNDTITVDDQSGQTGDTIRGGRGDDSLQGGPGNDSMFGGPGDDTINGGGGSDNLDGGGGNDSVTGGGGGVQPGAGSDALFLSGDNAGRLL